MYTEIIVGDNLEFTLNPDTGKISKKILYRSFSNHVDFKRKIYNYIIQGVSEELRTYITKIFEIPETQDLIFHFGEDSTTRRIKFYISLYDVPLKTSLQIISQIKKILGIESYVLEKDFTAFDCLGFDIKEDKIILKVYELVSLREIYVSQLPAEFDVGNVKECGFLKSGKRKKIFFRFKNPMDVSDEIISSTSYKNLQEKLGKHYKLLGKIRYYCREEQKEEIYFI